MASMGNDANGSGQGVFPVQQQEAKSAIKLRSVLRLLEQQGHRCALTGRQLTPEVASLDHVVPVERGGNHCIENAQILHKEVNRAKHTMTNEEFVALCYEVVRHWEKSHDGPPQGR